MSDDALQKAINAASEAAQDSQHLELMKAVVMAQTIAQAMQQPTTQQQASKPQFDTKKWAAITGLVCAGGLVASLFAVAVAIGAVSVAILALVLRGLWADFQKNR